ncbi:MAG: hypothetical protein EOM67_00655 [Spirochaetia bacterium]|nr:hypothetical protein [Spirochaetia bacterium]
MLSMVPDYGGDIKKFCKYLMRITKIFIGNNATTRASKDLWAHELIGSIPTGVLVDKSSIFSIGTKEGFAYLLQHAETLLEGEVDKIRKYGSDFWKATPQLSEMLKRIQDGYEELPIEFPEIVNVVPPISSSKNPNFLTWWDMVVEERYQKDLYRVIKEAWYGSVHQFSGGSLLRTMDDAEEFGNEDDDADFSSWWSLFDPNKRDKQ